MTSYSPGASARSRERNSVRTKILYAAVERTNELLAAEDRPPLPDGLTFHSLRRTYAALRAELGEHPAITAAQMGHRDPRMTLRVDRDVTGMQPRTRMGGLLERTRASYWAPVPNQPEVGRERRPARNEPESPPDAGTTPSGSDGTRTRDLRRDRPAL